MADRKVTLASVPPEGQAAVAERPAPPLPSGLPREPAAPDDTLDLPDLVATLWRRRLLILLSALLALLTALAIDLAQPSRYTATATLILEPERIRIIDLDDVVARPDADQAGIQNELAILRSGEVLERVIADLSLHELPDEGASPHPLSSLLATVRDRVAAVEWPPPAAHVLRRAGLLPGPGPAEGARPDDGPPPGLLRSLAGGLRLRQLGQSHVIEIGFTATDPDRAIAIVNAVGEVYLRLQEEQRRAEIERANAILGDRLQDLERRLRAAEEAARAAELALAVTAENGAARIAGQIEVLARALAEARGERLALGERLDRARAAIEGGEDLRAVPDFRASPVVAAHLAREIDLIEQREALQSLKRAEGNPALTRLEAQIAAVRAGVETEARRIVRALEIEREAALAREDRLTAELADLERRGLDRAGAEIRLARLEREAESVRALHRTFLDRLNRTTEQLALGTPQARLITRATGPLDPDRDRAGLLLPAALLAGLGLGIGIVLFLDRLAPTFRRAGDVEAATGLGLLAGIPRAGRKMSPQRLLAAQLDRPAGPLAESARNLRTSILFSNLDLAPRVIMVASSLPGEGKTATALLAAVASQQMERSAIILDCDLRRSTLGRIFARHPEQPGLLACLQGSAPIEDCIHIEPETGLSVLAAERLGPGSGNAADILASRRFHRLLAQLKARYDFVILDTPPVLAVADARILAPSVDAIVYLVRWNHTRRAAVIEGIRDLRSVGGRIAGIAFTQVDERQARKFLDAGYLYKSAYS
jgi:succinoglycan biosynthesis transport protein ExoP